MIDRKTLVFAAAYDELRTAAINLREAQMVYMLDRGNEALGQRVADAAAKLDEILVADGYTPPTAAELLLTAHRYSDRNELIPAELAAASTVTFPDTYIKS